MPSPTWKTLRNNGLVSQYAQGSTGAGWWEVTITHDGKLLIAGPAAAQLRLVLGRKRSKRAVTPILGLMNAR